MANNPKKMKDPTDQALNAIQEVLSTTDQPSGRTEPAMDQASAPSPREATRRGRRDAGAAAVEKELFDSPTADDMRAGTRAANDDRQSIGQILQTLQRRPARTSYIVATVFAFAWVIGGAALAFLFLPELQGILK